MTVLFIVIALPLAKAQVHVGDILYEDNSVGESGGKAIGVVFYVDGTKQHGWAVALNDEGELSWGPNWVSTPVPDRTSLQGALADVNGYANTKKILSLDNPADIYYPAFEAMDFSNGWYLPAVGQLKKLYRNLDKVNAGLSAAGGTVISIEEGNEFWSSTEYSDIDAWYVSTIGGLDHTSNGYNDNKNGTRLVRSIKDF